MPPRRAGRPRRNAQVPNRGGREVPPPPPPQERRMEELFLRQNPSVFNGLGDPAGAETWIRALERIFDFLRCNDQERLTCVAFQLTRLADFWWDARRKTMTPEQLGQMTWEEFKIGLYYMYIPKSYRKAKEFENYNLKQGQMSVTEYDRMFCDMARYAPNQTDTDEKMAEKFCAGVRHEIRMTLASHRGLSYAESLSRALDIEAAMLEERLEVNVAPPPFPQKQNFREKRKWDVAQNPPQYGGRQAAPNQRGDFRPKAPRCAKCSRNHFGECRVGTNRGYIYGGNGHFHQSHNNMGINIYRK